MGRRDTNFATATHQIGDVLVLSMTGELDMATAPALEEAVEQAQGGSAIVIDLRELTFIDSMGIKVLLQVYTAGQNGHSTVSFIRGQERVQRVLRIAGIEQFLTWTDPPAPVGGPTVSVGPEGGVEHRTLG
jgi:anti-anti-sigma factor